MNGLIGIFGQAFSTDREVGYSSDDQAAMKVLSKELENKSIKEITKHIVAKKMELRELTERNLKSMLELSANTSKNNVMANTKII